jgi:hypothetical protein
LKPNKPLDSEVSNNTKANASTLFKSIGTADFDNKFAKKQQDTLFKYPKADKIAIAGFQLYFLCTLCKSSTKLSDQQKIDAFTALVEIQDGLRPPLPPKPVATIVQPQPTLLETPKPPSIVGCDNISVEQAAADAKASADRAEAIAAKIRTKNHNAQQEVE